MKVKEIKEKESKIKEIEEEPVVEEETKEIIEDDIEQFSYDDEEKPETEDKTEEETKVDEERRHSSLEEAVLDVPISLETTEEKRDGNFYKSSTTIGDFYSGNRPDFYSQSESIYSTSSEGSNYSIGEKNNNEEGSFYSNTPKNENERVGEIHGARGSKLEIEGVRGFFGLKKDSRRTEEKYTPK